MSEASEMYVSCDILIVVK